MSAEVSQPEWNRAFRLRVLALMLDSNWWARYGSQLIVPEYFPLKEERIFVSIITEFYHNYHRPPDIDEYDTLLDKFEDDETVKEETIDAAEKLFPQIYEGSEEWDLDFAEEYIIQFTREQAYKLAILECVDFINEGGLHKIEPRINQAKLVGRNLKDLGIFLKDDAVDWIIDVATEEKIPTGIYHVDKMLGGGLARGELGVILGPTNRGKSRALINIAYGAAGWGSRCNVCYATMELSKVKTAGRFGARTTSSWLADNIAVKEYYERFIKDAQMLLDGEVNIVEWPSGKCSVGDLYNHLELLDSAGFKVDLLIVDSEDDMTQYGSSGSDMYRSHGDNYTKLRGLAQELNIAVWTASQGTRGSSKKDTVDLEDTSESWRKPAKADVVLSWSQTRDEANRNEMRFFCAKNRAGVKWFYVRCELDEDAHSIVSVGILDGMGNEIE